MAGCSSPGACGVGEADKRRCATGVWRNYAAQEFLAAGKYGTARRAAASAATHVDLPTPTPPSTARWHGGAAGRFREGRTVGGGDGDAAGPGGGASRPPPLSSCRAAGIAATLSSTSPIFILPLAAIFLGDVLRWRTILGAVIAVLGVGLLFL